MVTGLVMTMIIVFTGQKVHSQFYYGLQHVDSLAACNNIPHDGYIYWQGIAASYVTGDSIDYFVDWGDGNNSSYLDNPIYLSAVAYSGISTSHTYTSTGTFVRLFTAIDEYSNSFSLFDTIIVGNACGFVSGNVRLDDGDNIFEFGDDMGASNIPIIVNTNLSNYGTNTSLGGWFDISSIDHSATSYEIKIDPLWLSANGFTVISPVGGSYTFSSPPIGWASYEFLLDCGASYSDASISGYGWGFRPGTADGFINFNINNFTCDGTPANVDLSVGFDPMLTLASTNIPGFSITGNTINASITNINNTVNYYAYFTVPPGTPSFTPLVFDLNIDVTNYTDAQPADNHYVINSEVRNS